MSGMDRQDRTQAAVAKEARIVFASVHGHAQVPVIVSADVGRLAIARREQRSPFAAKGG